MKKGLLALCGLIVLAVMGFGVIGSGAWFTDQSSVPISATSGKLDIQAAVGKEGGGVSIYDPSGTAIPVSNLAPGVYDTQNVWMIDVQNKPTAASTLDAKYRYRATYGSGSGPLWANTIVKVEKGDCVDVNTISNASTVYNGLLKDMSFTSADAGKTVLPVNTTHCYRFSFKLDDAAGNDLQGLSGVFNIVIDATQATNPGW